MSRILALAFLIFAMAMFAGAEPLTLEYSVTPQAGGLFSYSFKLTNNGMPDGASIDWLIFGSVYIEEGWDGTGPTPTGYGVGSFGVRPGGLWYETDFEMTSPIPGPWAELTSSGGGFNGPTFGPVIVTPWVPNLGDFLFWTGTSHHDVGDELFFSVLNITDVNGDVLPYIGQQRATTLTPEPSSLLLMGSGASCLLWLRRRKA